MAKGTFSHLSFYYPHYQKYWPNLFSRKSAFFFLWLLAVSLLFLLSFLYSPRPSRSSVLRRPADIVLPHLDDHDHSININDHSHDQEYEEDQVQYYSDFFDGKWVRDVRGPTYTNSTCRTLPGPKNCLKYGKNPDYLNWRWKPKKTELPGFDPPEFLEMMRGKRLAFVGDSVARNQMESLLCILGQIEEPFDVEKDEEDRFRTWYFRSHNFTFMVWWTKFLTIGVERVVNGSATGVYDLHMDKVDPSWTDNLPHSDYLIVSGGHWFFRPLYLYERGRVVGCVFCSDPNVTAVDIGYAVRRSLRSALEYINTCEGCDGIVTLVRTFTPGHFDGGDWNNGGYCNRTRPWKEKEMSLGRFEWDIRKGQVAEVKRMMRKRRRGARWFGLLDVTKAMTMRPDAHPNSHLYNPWNMGYNDCVHWCLPGPVDMWNDLLLAVLKREQALDDL